MPVPAWNSHRRRRRLLEQRRRAAPKTAAKRLTEQGGLDLLGSLLGPIIGIGGRGFLLGILLFFLKLKLQSRLVQLTPSLHILHESLLFLHLRLRLFTPFPFFFWP